MEFIHQTSHDGNADCLEPASLFKKEKKKKNQICFSAPSRPHRTPHMDPSLHGRSTTVNIRGRDRVLVPAIFDCIDCISASSHLQHFLSGLSSLIPFLGCICFDAFLLQDAIPSPSTHVSFLPPSTTRHILHCLLLIHLPGTTGVITFSTGFLLFEIYLESVIFCIVLNLDKYT